MVAILFMEPSDLLTKALLPLSAIFCIPGGINLILRLSDTIIDKEGLSYSWAGYRWKTVRWSDVKRLKLFTWKDLRKNPYSPPDFTLYKLQTSEVKWYFLKDGPFDILEANQAAADMPDLIDTLNAHIAKHGIPIFDYRKGANGERVARL